MQDFRKLDVWTKAHELTLKLYRISRAFPDHEVYGLTSQMRRSASSIGANLCEGCGRSSDMDFARYVQHAFSSASELDYHLLLAKDLGYLEPNVYDQQNNDLQQFKRMLNAFLQKLRANS
jgi:four helix bundle protein